MAHPKTLIREPWNPSAAAGLSRAMGEYLDYLAQEVSAGRADLYRIPEHGWIAFRREGSELVCLAAEGRGLMPIFRAIVEGTSAKSIRIHTRRRGMGRYLAPLGFRLVEHRECGERVYRVVINGQQ